MSTQQHNLIGHTFGTYRLDRILGVGGMSTVFLGTKPDGAVAAVKVLFLPWQVTPTEMADFHERFRREAQSLASLNHPHIPRVLGSGTEGNYDYLVLQYIDGGTLSERLARGPMAFDEIARIVQQVGSAIDYTHSQGIVHRDVKPTNVLLDSQGNAYLADFGIIYLLDGLHTKLTSTGGSIGTPEYMSPEQAAGVPVGPQTDIYNLGLLAYVMVAGRPPFLDTSVVQLGIKHIQETPPSPHMYRNDLPGGAEDAILRALAKSPDQRFHSAQDFARAFDDGLRSTWRRQSVPLNAPTLPPTIPPAYATPAPPVYAPTPTVYAPPAQNTYTPSTASAYGPPPQNTYGPPTIYATPAPNLANQPPVRKNNLALMLGGILVVVVILGIVLMRVTQSGGTTSPNQTGSSISASVPTLASSYRGTVTNRTVVVTTTLILTNIIQNNQDISGRVIIGPGLVGSGPFTGRINQDRTLICTDTPDDGSATIIFKGIVGTSGTLSGTYIVQNANQGGSWNAAP